MKMLDDGAIKFPKRFVTTSANIRGHRYARGLVFTFHNLVFRCEDVRVLGIGQAKASAKINRSADYRWLFDRPRLLSPLKCAIVAVFPNMAKTHWVYILCYATKLHLVLLSRNGAGHIGCY